MTDQMHTTFQRLCIRPEVGFVYDKNSMVELQDGLSFSEMLVKVTSKCDTNFLLLSSHKGKVKDFSVKLIGIENPQSSQTGVLSSVFSGVKNSFSFLNSSSASEDQLKPLSDVDQIAEAWIESQENGFHGLQVLALVDKESMPDNDSRKLYNLHQFVTIFLQSVNAYYMFQKPDVSFLYDTGFNADELKEMYPKADTFAIAAVWKFAENPLEQSVSSSLKRATPIVNSKSQRLPREKDNLFKFDSPNTSTSLAVKKRLEDKRQSLLREFSRTPDNKASKSKINSPVELIKSRKSLPMEESQESFEEEKSESESEEDFPVTTGRTNCLKPVTPEIQKPIKVVTPPRVTRNPSVRGRRERIVPPTIQEPEEPSADPKEDRKKVAKSRTSRRSTKRTVAESTGSEDEEIVVSSKMSRQAEPMDFVDTTYPTPVVDESDIIDASCIDMPDDSAPKVRIGRKSMVASARKTLASEWPPADQEAMLHFFDNLNPKQSETSRIALTCKYALLQYNRDLSSKLLFQWVGKKGRTIQRQVTDFSLKEEEVKQTVLELYNSLSDVQAEATRVSFSLKFMQSQYSAKVSSKQLFAWLK